MGIGKYITRRTYPAENLQASIPTQDDRIQAGIAKQMINEGTAPPVPINNLEERINISNQFQMPLDYSASDLQARARRAMTQPGMQIELAPYEKGIPEDLQFWDGRPFTATPYDPYKEMYSTMANKNPVQQGLKSIDIGMAPSIYTIDPAMMHAAKMQRMDRGNMNNYPMINRITDKVSSGLGTLRDTISDTTTGFYDTIGGGIKSILDNTFLGRIAAARDATNPRAGNYNPRLQEQIDFIKEQGLYGVNPNTGLNQITGGVLAGKNLQSAFGSNDLMTMYEKELARANKVLDNLPNQWSRLKETDPEEYNKKLAWHKNKVNKIKTEQAAAAAAAKAAADQRIAAERTAGAAANQATQRRAGKGGDHMSRSISQGGLGISKAQAQAVSDANKAAGMGGWGLKEGGLASLWRR